MKKILLLITILSTFGFADKYEVILKEISSINKQLVTLQHNMDKRFEQVDKRFEQVDKRFDQIDKRFEQVDKRIDGVNTLLYTLMAFVFASPFIAIYLRDQKEKNLRAYIKEQVGEYKKIQDNQQALIFALRENAQNNESMAKSLKLAGLDKA